MTEDTDTYYTRLIDERLELLYYAGQSGDTVARGWHKLILGALVVLRRVVRASEGQ